MTAKRLMTLAEFTETYGISRATIYREHAEGRLPFVKAGRRTLVATEDAEKWLCDLPRSGAANA